MSKAKPNNKFSLTTKDETSTEQDCLIKTPLLTGLICVVNQASDCSSPCMSKLFDNNIPSHPLPLAYQQGEAIIGDQAAASESDATSW